MATPAWLKYKGDLISVENSPIKTIHTDNLGNIVVMFQDGTTASYPHADAEATLQNISIAIAAPNPAPFSITSITPDPFDIMSDTITITGTGFSPSKSGFICISDYGCPAFDDPYKMVCTYVNETTMTAVFTSSGTLPDGSCIVYFQGIDGYRSNLLVASVASLVVTI